MSRKLAPILIVVSLISFASPAFSQAVSYESVKLADYFVQNTWESVQGSLPLMVAGVEHRLNGNGVSSEQSKAFANNLTKALSRDNFTKAIAQLLTKKLTPTEIVELTGFMQSNIGRKYLMINSEVAGDAKIFTPIFQQACDETKKGFESAARSNLDAFCNLL